MHLAHSERLSPNCLSRRSNLPILWPFLGWPYSLAVLPIFSWKHTLFLTSRGIVRRNVFINLPQKMIIKMVIFSEGRKFVRNERNRQWKKKKTFLVRLFLAWKTVAFVDRGIGRSCLIFESPSSLHPFHALFGVYVRVQQSKVIEMLRDSFPRGRERSLWSERC